MPTLEHEFVKSISKMPTLKKSAVRIRAHLNNSLPIIAGNMNTMDKTMDTCQYLLSQSWVNHYPYSHKHPYIDLGLNKAAVFTCSGLLEMLMEIKYADTSNHLYLMWSIFSTTSGVLLVIGCSGWVRSCVPVIKMKLTKKSKKLFSHDLELMEGSQASIERKDMHYSLSGGWAQKGLTREESRLYLSPSTADSDSNVNE